MAEDTECFRTDDTDYTDFHRERVFYHKIPMAILQPKKNGHQWYPIVTNKHS